MSTAHNNIITMSNIITAGLQRKAVNTCSKWATSYRIMGKPYPGPFSFLHHPWAKEMHDADESWCGMKCAQMGFTETALNRVFFTIDIHRLNCMYFLPNRTPDASDFSTSRFDAAIELSTHLHNLFSDVKNIGHKRAGSVNLYIRGMRSRSQLKSIDAALLVFDERDEMKAENVILARERTSGQEVKQFIEISTPTVPEKGIDLSIKSSTMELFYFQCPHCSRFVTLSFEDDLIVTGEDVEDPNLKHSYIQCPACKAKLPHEDKISWLSKSKHGWTPSRTNAEVRGFCIHQLYSFQVTPYEIAQMRLLAAMNPAIEQEYYNSKGGMAHAVAGARISDTDLEACIASHASGDYKISTNFVTIGIDVGTWLHYEVDAYDFSSYSADVNSSTHCSVMEFGKVKQFEELDRLIQKYRPNCVVIDGNPERREALKLAYRFPGIVYICFYGNNISGKTINVSTDAFEPKVTVDRTTWLDQSLSRFKNKTISIPKNVSIEYKDQLKALVRTYEKDEKGNHIGTYVTTGSSGDHFGHARNYAEIALAVGAANGVVQNMATAPA